MTSMFWGLKLEPGKRYSTTVDKSFHISMATLDATSVNSEKEVVSVALEEGESEFLLTNLRAKDALFSHLDLNFLTGDRITLFCKGQGLVHLSGYMVLDDDDELSTTMMDEEAEDEEEDEDIEDVGADEILLNKARKALMNASKGKNAITPVNQKRKLEVEANNKAKKKKIDLTSGGDDDDESEEESGDGDVDDLNDLADEESDADEEEDDEDEDDDDDEDEEEEEPVKPAKKQQNQQQKQNQQKNKSPNKEQQQQQQQGKKQKQPQLPKTPNGIVSPGQKQQQSGKKEEKKKSLPASPAAKDQKQQNQKESTLTGGVKVKDMRVGNGPLCKEGKMVSVYYTGRLKNNGKVFDSVLQGSGFKFKLGKGEVIPGWDVGLAGMKVGGKRIITCPPHAAYGAKGSLPQIPPNSTLVFEVELKGVN